MIFIILPLTYKEKRGTDGGLDNDAESGEII